MARYLQRTFLLSVNPPLAAQFYSVVAYAFNDSWPQESIGSGMAVIKFYYFEQSMFQISIEAAPTY